MKAPCRLVKCEGHSNLVLTIACFLSGEREQACPVCPHGPMRLSTAVTDSGSMVRHILLFVSQCHVFFHPIRVAS